MRCSSTPRGAPWWTRAPGEGFGPRTSILVRDGVIAGAALDVFEREPELHPGLIELEQVLLVPHLGSATVAVREAMGLSAASALRAVLLERRLPANAVNAVPVPRA